MHTQTYTRTPTTPLILMHMHTQMSIHIHTENPQIECIHKHNPPPPSTFLLICTLTVACMHTHTHTHTLSLTHIHARAHTALLPHCPSPSWCLTWGQPWTGEAWWSWVGWLTPEHLHAATGTVPATPASAGTPLSAATLHPQCGWKTHHRLISKVNDTTLASGFTWRKQQSTHTNPHLTCMHECTHMRTRTHAHTHTLMHPICSWSRESDFVFSSF